MFTPPSVQEISAAPSLVRRQTIPAAELAQFLGAAYGDIMNYITPLGVAPQGPPFVTYYNMDMTALDVAAGFPLSAAVPTAGDLLAGTAPHGRCAVIHYTGPYDQIAPAYETLTAWVAAQGLTPTGIAHELYLNDPGEVPPAEYQTQVLFELA
jgi:effector-binding domain-containing protein